MLVSSPLSLVFGLESVSLGDLRAEQVFVESRGLAALGGVVPCEIGRLRFLGEALLRIAAGCQQASGGVLFVCRSIRRRERFVPFEEPVEFVLLSGTPTEQIS